MANSEFIEFLSPSALKDLQTANAELVTMISNVDKVGNKMKGITSPSGSDSAVKNLNTKLIQQEKLYTDLQIKLQKHAQAQAQSAIKTNQLEASTIRLNKQKELSIKQLEREQAKLNASANVYNKVQQKLNALSNEYKSLAVRKELSGKLTDKEAQRYDFLQGKIQKYDATLKAVDATMGKYQRNVGNYASAFNPLSNSINQLTREMPAFTYSVQTGFMALSNNIPIFTDAIGNAIKQNKLLQAEGKPTTSVLSQVAGAFLSWGTVLSVGITLLTVYGKEIGEFIKDTFKASQSVDSLKEAQKQLNDASTEGAKNAVDETLKLKSLLAIAKDTTLTYKERMVAVNELQDTYPAYFGNLQQEEILAGNTALAEKELTNAIIARAKANAAAAKITENQGKIIDIEVERLALRKELKEIDEAILITQKKLQNADNVTNSEGIALSQMYDKRKDLINDINKLSGEKYELDKVGNVLTSFMIEKDKEAIKLKIKDLKITKDKTDAKKKENKENKEIETFLLGSIGWYQQQIKLLEQQAEVIKANSTVVLSENEAYTKQLAIIADYQLGLEKLLGVKKELVDNEGIALNLGGSEFITDADGDALMEAGNKLRELLKEFKQGFIDDFANQSGFGKMLDILGGGLDKFEGDAVATALAVSDAFQEAFNTIAEMSNANFENEYNNLEKQKEIALLFAGDSASAREEIERQAEAKQREIRRREFQAQKAQALFNIAINTAQAVIGALATLPAPSAVPLSIAVGAIGLVQAGIVASRQVPAFWKGTDNAPEGWALTQEKGREIITDKNGKIKSYGNDKGATMTYLNKGDKVKTASETMDFLMFNNDLNSMLSNNNIGMPMVNVQNNKTDLTPVVNAINNKESFQLNIDENGFNKLVRNGNSIKELIQRRGGFKGYGV